MAEKKKWTAEEIMSVENEAAAPYNEKGAGYEAISQKYLDDYNNNKFSYNADEDPLYRAAAEAYRRQGAKNAKNVQAKAAEYTGGYGNSYGAMAAQQQYNEAAGKIAELMPEYEANAYGKFRQEQSDRLAMADYYAGRADSEYQKGQNAANDARYGEETAYNRDWNADERDYTRSQTENELAYAREQDRMNQQWSIALQKAEVGDYSGLKALGVDTSSQVMRDNLTRAAEWAQYGDYSLLEALGIDTTRLKAADSQTAAAGASSGSTSKSKSKTSSSEKSSSKTGSAQTTTSLSEDNLDYIRKAFDRSDKTERSFKSILEGLVRADRITTAERNEILNYYRDEIGFKK